MYIYRFCIFNIMQSRNRHPSSSCIIQCQYLYFSTSKESKLGNFPLVYDRHVTSTPVHRLYTCW